MRRLSILALALLATACAKTPPPTATPVTVVKPRVTGELANLTAAELTQRFGQPSFQVREGSGLKLQWSNRTCVLDAYLYPAAGSQGGERVVHVDARQRSGADTDVHGCVIALAR